MSQLGERLRQARESQGITLAEAAAETRIRQQSLVALEEGQYNRLPNDVVARGFIRNYAHFLGLPPDELIDLYRIEQGSTTQIQVVPATSLGRSRSYVLPGFFAIFFVTVAIVALTYLGLNAVGQVRDDTLALLATPTPTTSPPTPTSLSTPTALGTAQEGTGNAGGATDSPNTPDGAAATPPLQEPTIQVLIPELEITPTPTNTQVVTQAAPIVLNVAVQGVPGEGSWLQIETDGTVVYEGILYTGQEQVFLAQQNVSVYAGNPTAVLVQVNGNPPQYLGQIPNVPVFWAWPPQ